MALNDFKIQQARKEKSKPFKLFDGGGLYILATEAGSTIWKWKFYYLNKEQTYTIGKYPQIGIKQARALMYEASVLLANGTNPNEQKKQDKKKALKESKNSFRAISEEWLAVKKNNVSEQHANKLWRALENHVFPTLGNIDIDKIEPEDVRKVISKIEDDGKTEISKKTLQACHQIFGVALFKRLVSYNAASDVRIFLKEHKGQHYPFLPAHEMPEFLKQLERLNTSKQNKLAMRLLMHTFVRTGEMRKSKWEYINWEKKVWEIPAEVMKMKKPHTVPLSTQVIDILKELHYITGHNKSGYILPSQNRQKHPMMSENTINKMIANMGYKGRIVGHGLRSFASTNLHEMKFSHAAIETQLSHKLGSMSAQAYNHAEYMDERTPMMQRWSDYLEGLEKGYGYMNMESVA